MFDNILIIKLSAIGDVIHALPVAQALKICYPGCRITWIVEQTAYDLLADHPHIDELILFEKPKFKSVAGFLRHTPGFAAKLRKYQFDLVLDLQGLFKSGMIALLSGAATRLVYQNAREGSQYVSKRICGPSAHGHVVERYLDVVRSLGHDAPLPVFDITTSSTVAEQAQRILRQAGLGSNSRYVVLALGANWANKIWPPERFAALVDRLFDANIVPVVAGGPGDSYLLEQLLAHVAVLPVSIVGKTSLPQLAAVIRGAAAFVGGDTGPMHLSAALGVPTLALMGPTDQVRNGPYGAQHAVIVADRPCRGCWQRKCRYGLDCLDVIGVDEVWQAMAKLI